MAGMISGIVALTTSFLGIGGTVIGAVLGAIIYQIISILVKEPLESSTIRQIENDIVYTIPLIIIAIILTIFLMAYINAEFLMYYSLLKDVTENNLLRIMGIGLIIMGIYPLIQSKSIDKKYGAIVLFLGVVLLFRGFIDIDSSVQTFYTLFFREFDYPSLAILIGLLFVIVKIIIESVKLYGERDKSSIDREVESIKRLRELYGSGEIKSSETTTISKDKDVFHKIKFNKSDKTHKDDENQNEKNKE